MSAENRLSADQLTALASGDTVTMETSYGDRRPRLRPGTVVRVSPAEIVVSTRDRGGAKYVERYRRRDGVRISGGAAAQLVNLNVEEQATLDMLRRRTSHIDVLYRQWSRHRGDIEALRQLHTAIADYLTETTPVG